MSKSDWGEPLSGFDELLTAVPDEEALPTGVASAPVAPVVLRARANNKALDFTYDYFSARRDAFGPAVRRALDEVISTSRTGRWNLDQCNNQEKAYVGVNLENILRAEFALPEGRLGMDYDVDGIDVDCKWSRSFGGWQIPREAVGHICLLVYGDDLLNQLAVGLVEIEESLLVGGNRDQKRTIQRPRGINAIRWVIAPGEAKPPENFLMSLGKADRDAILAPRGGDLRAIQLFWRCEGIVLNRRVLEAVGQQVDEARRFRGETRAQLAAEGLEVLNGHWKKDRRRALELGGPVISNSSEWVALRSDGSTPDRLKSAAPRRKRESELFRAAMLKELKELSRERSRRRAARKNLDILLADAIEENSVIEKQISMALEKAETSAVEMVVDIFD